MFHIKELTIFFPEKRRKRKEGITLGPIVLGVGKWKKKKEEREEEGGHRNGQKYCTFTSFFKKRFLLVKLPLICSL